MCKMASESKIRGQAGVGTRFNLIENIVTKA